jgi:hypothetical protein
MEKPFRKPPYRTPQAVADAIKNILKDKIVCELGCAEGDNLVFMSKHAKKVFGIEYDLKRYRVAQERGLDVSVGDYYEITKFPEADVFYFWPDDGEKDSEYLLNKILKDENFKGTVVIGGDPGFPPEIPSLLRCAERGALLEVPYDEGSGHRENGVFYLAIVRAK